MNDSGIIDLYLNRDESAISLTAEKYGNYCKKIARNILCDEQDAEECVNSTYLKVWKKIPPEKPNVFYAFLARITRNTAIDIYRKNKRRSADLSLIFEELSGCVSDNETPERTVENREILKAVNDFLNSQPKRNRQLFVSRYCCCETVKELALRFGMTESGVSVSLCRIRKKLKERLKKEGFEI